MQQVAAFFPLKWMTQGMRIPRLVLHTAFAMLLGTALVLASAGVVGGPRPAPVAALLVWVAAYVVLGVPALHGSRGVCSVAYLVVLVAVLAVVATVEPALLFLMF